MRPLQTFATIIAVGVLSVQGIGAADPDAQRQLNTVESALAEPVSVSQAETPALSEAEAKSAGSLNSDAVSSNNTLFNGIEVPPMKELTGPGLTEEIKHGYWFVKHYSPWCGHCIDIAPTWQTLYEFYYTMEPVPSQKEAGKGDSMNSFTRYYDFHFASLDCIAFGDTCSSNGINAFPTFTIYHDGEALKKFDQFKNMENLSKFVEAQLETIRPGSRSRDQVVPPLPGATSSTPALKQSREESKNSSLASAAQIVKDEMASVKEAVNDKISVGAASANDKPKMTATATTSQTSADAAPIPADGKSIPVATDGGTSITKTSKSTQSRKKKPAGPPNPIGTSISLTQESFQKLVTNTQDSWFIKFYAPWCHHCQALAPSWLQMAKELQGKLNIGEVNCDAESRLCKDVRVKSYPTIHFFRGGERVEYDGLRGLGDLVSYAKKALDVGGGVQDVDMEAFKKMELTEEVIFVYFYDHATATEDFESLERLTLSLVGHAKLVKTDDPKMAERYKISTWPRLLVSRDGRASYYEALAPRDMRDFRQILTWMQKVWLPIVPELTASNAKEIMQGKYVVLGILSRERADEFALDKKELKNAALEWMEKQTLAFQLERKELRDAKQLRLEEAEDRNDERAKRGAKSIHIDIREDDKKQVGFAWVDGTFWERWIRTTYGINVKEGERVIINDEDNFRYWDTTISGAWITPSRTSILETIPKVIASPPKISSRSTTGWVYRIFFSITGIATGHPYLSSILVLCSLFLAWSYRKGSSSSSKPGSGRRRGISLGGGFLGALDEKERGIGGVGNGKAD